MIDVLLQQHCTFVFHHCLPFLHKKRMLRARGKNRNNDLPSNDSSLAFSSALQGNDEGLDNNHHDEHHYHKTTSGEAPSTPASLRRSRLRKRSRKKCGFCKDIMAAPSPFMWILWCLSFAVALEVGYILSLGAFSDGTLWSFFSGSSLSLPASSISSNNNNNPSDSKFRVRTPSDKPPIDSYYSRRHIRDPVPLVVGGSDGSGTRAFVELLLSLGVPMLVEDFGTMDVHGKEIYDGAGWPALVTKVLNVTHSASYQLDDLPLPLVASGKEQIAKFLRQMKLAGETMVQAGIGQTWATGISWGFKAPVSVLLLPFFRDQLPAVKVLHIVRDGRDVALSENHSPVQKFYADFYVDASERHKELLAQEDFGKDARTNVKAMQLWNDWNKQIYDYGVRYSDGESFEVLVMRTEDLLHYPLESVALLADFVGSLKSSKQLCCLCRRTGKDLGQSGGGDPFDEEYEAGDPGDAGSFRVPRMVDPGDFDQIRKRFAQMKDHQHGRRLSENPNDSDKAPDLFKTGGRLSSENHPGNDLAMQAENAQPHQAVRMSSQALGQVARMQQLLQERRASARKTPKAQEDPEKVKLRYGKWMKALENNPELSQRLHQEGREALALFGYEPAREFMAIHPHPELLAGCDSSLKC